MADQPSKGPAIKVPTLKGIDLRASKSNLDSGESDRIFGLRINQDGSLSSMPGKRLLIVQDDNSTPNTPVGVPILGTAQLFNGTGSIVMQMGASPNNPSAGGSLAIYTLDELFNRVTGTNLVPTASDLEENMPYALLGHLQNNGVAGGSLSGAGADNVFAKRTITTELVDSSGFVTLSSNEFTVPTGVYRIRAKIGFSYAGTLAVFCKAGLYSVTGSAFKTDVGTSNEIIGTAGVYQDLSGNRMNGWVELLGRFEVTAGTEAFAIYQAGTVNGVGGATWYNNASGLGSPSSGVTSKSEVYCLIELIQET